MMVPDPSDEIEVETVGAIQLPDVKVVHPSCWLLAADLLPQPEDNGRPQLVLAWGSLFNGTKPGPLSFLLATVQVHPSTGPFWRAHGSLADVKWWTPLPHAPAGEPVMRKSEPSTGAF